MLSGCSAQYYNIDERDWVLLRVDDFAYYTEEWFEIEVPQEGTVLKVDNVGWGALKILSIEEIMLPILACF